MQATFCEWLHDFLPEPMEMFASGQFIPNLSPYKVHMLASFNLSDISMLYKKNCRLNLGMQTYRIIIIE